MDILIPIIPSTTYYSRPRFSSRGCGLRQQNAPFTRFLNSTRSASSDDWFTPADMVEFILGSSGNENPKAKDAADKTQKQNGSVGNAIVKNNLFEVKLNVNEYKPDELNVKIADGMVTIEGQHEESKINTENSKDNIHDEEFISRRFKRSFKLPENIMEDKIECQLSSDGQLIVTAPLKAIEPPVEEENVRMIPISIVNSETTEKVQPAETEESKKVDTTGSKTETNESSAMETTTIENCEL